MAANHEIRQRLVSLLSDNEEWLIERVLDYAKAQEYTKYTSTLKEAWRISIEGLSQQLIAALDTNDHIPEMRPDESYPDEPIAAFGILQAQRHRTRGVTLGMFLGLMKYYAQSYLDLIDQAGFTPEDTSWSKLFARRCFDRMELGFCVEWAGQDREQQLKELQDLNRSATNEKNRYLTVFESLGSAVFFLNEHHQVVNENHVAARLFGQGESPGAVYYGRLAPIDLPSGVLDELETFGGSQEIETVFEKVLETNEGVRYYSVILKRMLDVSEKFMGTTVILHDISSRVEAEKALKTHIAELKRALSEIQTLQGMLPICAYCKRIRDDQDYWQEVASYISAHSNAVFSHGVCPECFEKIIEPELREAGMTP